MSLSAMGVVTTGDIRINILYYCEIDNARSFQYNEKRNLLFSFFIFQSKMAKRTFTFDHLTRTHPGNLIFSTFGGRGECRWKT